MKTTLLVCYAIMVTLSAVAQTIEVEKSTGKYQAQGIITLDSSGRDDLFQRSKEWIALNYSKAQDVISLSDKESGKLICKGNFKTSLFMKEGFIGHTLILEFKRGKFRYTYTDFNYDSNGSGLINFESNSLGFKKKLLKITEENVTASIQSLKKYLLQKGQQEKNW